MQYLTFADAEKMRELHRNGATVTEIANIYGICLSHASKILSGQRLTKDRFVARVKGNSMRKRCAKCKLPKHVNAFYFSKTGYLNRASICIDCYAEKNKNYRDRVRELS